MESLALYLIASVVVILTPGPDMIFVLTRGVSLGRRAGMLSAGGVALGLLFHTLAATLGLAAFLQAFPRLQSLIKMAGGLYLLYLGIRTLADRESPGEDKWENKRGNYLIQGFLSNALNPKIILFFLAFLPQFADTNQSDFRFRLLGLGLIFASVTWVIYTLMGLIAGSAGTWVVKSEKGQSLLLILSGILLIFLGGWFLLGELSPLLYPRAPSETLSSCICPAIRGFPVGNGFPSCSGYC